MTQMMRLIDHSPTMAQEKISTLMRILTKKLLSSKMQRTTNLFVYTMLVSKYLGILT